MVEIKTYSGEIIVISEVCQNYKIMVDSKLSTASTFTYVGNMKVARNLFLELTRKYDLTVTVLKGDQVVDMEKEVYKRQLKGYYDLDLISQELKDIAKSIKSMLVLNNSKR